MIVFGHMFAFCDSSQEKREIDIPDTALDGTLIGVLSGAFKFGQNEFQPRRCPSLSAGDVVEIPDGPHKGFYGVCMSGFEHLTEAQVATIRAARPIGSLSDHLPTEGTVDG